LVYHRIIINLRIQGVYSYLSIFDGHNIDQGQHMGEIPTVARHIFQACPVWIYTQSNAHINVNPVGTGGGGGRDSIEGLITKLILSLGHFLTCLSPGLNSAHPVRRLMLFMHMSSDA
jgi:hypothetical protein